MWLNQGRGIISWVDFCMDLSNGKKNAKRNHCKLIKDKSYKYAYFGDSFKIK